MSKFSLLTTLLGFIISVQLLAQDPHDLYSFNLKKLGDQIVLSNPKFLNSFNTNAYNNQPHFKNTKTLYLTSQMAGTQQTDIYSLNLYNRTKSQVTLFPDVKNVGYYHWLDSDRVALFLVGEPHSLVIGDASNNSISTITSNIGRGMGSTTAGELLFIQKLSDTTWYIKKLNSTTGKSTIVIETLEGSEDFIVFDGKLLMAKGTKIYTCPIDGGKSWTEVADLGIYGLKKITRMAFNDDRVLVVVD